MVGNVQSPVKRAALALLIVLGACSSRSTSSPESVVGPVATEPTASTTEPTTTSTTVTTTVATVPVPTYVDANGFDDHTVPQIASVAELLALSRPGNNGQTAMKFTIPNLAGGPVFWMDSNFYSLHDEWYWFRLLNGQRVPGLAVEPVAGGPLATVTDIYHWAQSHPPLPLDLVWSDSSTTGRRLYSPGFYELVLHASPRAYAVGSIIQFPDPTADKPAHWLLELEYTDVRTAPQIAQYFERIAQTVPAEVARNLQWVIRSPEQERVAQEMIAQKLPFGDRVVHYSDLVPAGQTTVYSEGITAGKLLYIGEQGSAQLGDATDGDIIVTEHVPDWLPPASALLTSSPQTPLAHVNLLARNRGIPNASLSGIHLDPGIRQAARVRAPAIVIAQGNELRVVLISDAQYKQWKSLRSKPATAVVAVDLASIPYTVDLRELAKTATTTADFDRWRPIIGGKSTGFLSLLSVPELSAPPDVMAITVRAYIEHVAPLRPLLEVMLADKEFAKSSRARFLVLEGPEEYAKFFTLADDKAYMDQFIATHPAGSAAGDLLAAGGVRAYVRSLPINPETLAVITKSLRETFGYYDTSVALRFRSSSSVEDIEGFNGAGLYTSYSGFLYAQLQSGKDADRTVEDAIKKTWGSYWGFEAFEERRLENVDHLSGAMGISVHARFNDDQERNNGVATFTFLRGGGPDDAVLKINVNPGVIAVTNPDPNASDLPEVIEITHITGRVPTIRRVSESTLSPGTQVFDDAAALELFRQTSAVAAHWRTRVNTSLPSGQQVQTVMLDFEFKTVDKGWPAMNDGTQLPARLVVRQVRSLEPGRRGISAEVLALPIPQDILSRSRLVQRVVCRQPDGSSATRVEVFTDPLKTPEMGFALEPFRIGATPAATNSCVTTVLYNTPEQFLRDLAVPSGVFTVISGG